MTETGARSRIWWKNIDWQRLDVDIDVDSVLLRDQEVDASFNYEHLREGDETNEKKADTCPVHSLQFLPNVVRLDHAVGAPRAILTG